MTIRTRLALWYSSLLAAVILVFAVSLFSLLSWTWREQQLDSMRQIAKLMLDDITYDELSGQITTMAIPEKVSGISASSFGIQVWHANGTLAASSSNVKTFSKPLDERSIWSAEPVWRELDTLQGPLLAYTFPIFNVSTGDIVGALQLVSSTETMNEALSRLVRVMIAIGVVALVLAFMVGSVLAGQALQPIETISETAKAITAADDLSKRIPYNGPPDELGQLATTFNATLERLERLFLVQRRFVADVSHELRTPLTAIMGNIDLMQRYGTDPVSLEAIESECKRMNRLVGDLLLLAQADSGRLTLREQVVDLASLAVEVYKQTKVLADGVEYRTGILDVARVKGDPDRLKQLLLNLITNALKYTPAGGKVMVSIAPKDGFAFITIRDTGIGIPTEDLPHIFDRFYRVDKARARQMGGSGLGLSIVSWIVEAHKGKIWAESELGKGSTFTVQLPLYEATMIPDSARETRQRISILRRPRLFDGPEVPSLKPIQGLDREDRLADE